MFQPQNATTRAGIVQPQEPERSGSPKSFAPWDTLGFEGRNFVATGPHADELTRINGKPAKEPIRVYAGLQTADTDEAANGRAAQRTRAHRTPSTRKVLVIIPTTGTGWVNPIAARSMEMMYNGDTALVASQYSFLPSWISFLGDQQKSMESGRTMIDAIHERWAKLPPDRRPKLVLYGESLGSMAGQGAFGWMPDIAEMGFSSVLWVGPPNASPLWKAHHRAPRPGHSGGAAALRQRANGAVLPGDRRSRDRRRGAPPWEGTRVLFLQHPSDPIVWWSPDLLFNRPDWLTEPPGRDRTASMRWYPIVTFWQVAADMTNAVSVPGGHGHNYGDYVLDGWVAVAPPDGWTAGTPSASASRWRRPRRKTVLKNSARKEFGRWGSPRDSSGGVGSRHGSRRGGIRFRTPCWAALAVSARAPLGLRQPAASRGCGWARRRPADHRRGGRGDSAATGAGGHGGSRPTRFARQVADGRHPAGHGVVRGGGVSRCAGHRAPTHSGRRAADCSVGGVRVVAHRRCARCR